MKINTLGTYVIQLDEKCNNICGKNTTNSMSMMRANKLIVVRHGRDRHIRQSLSFFQPRENKMNLSDFIHRLSPRGFDSHG